MNIKAKYILLTLFIVIVIVIIFQILSRLIFDIDNKIKSEVVEHSDYTIKYLGNIENFQNLTFEAFITRKTSNRKENSEFKCHINILKHNDSELVDATTYIIDNVKSPQKIESIYSTNDVQNNNYTEKDRTQSLIIASQEYYQYQDSVSGTGYGVQIYYPKGSRNQNHLFRLQTKNRDAIAWVENNYDNITAVFSYGRDVKLYHDAYSGTVWNNVDPLSSYDFFDVSVGYGFLSIAIPVNFQRITVENTGRSNLYYTTSGTDDWNDPYPNDNGPSSDGKVFISEWKVPDELTPGNNRIKPSIKYRVVGEDLGGIKQNFYITFTSSSYKYYDSNN